MRRSAAVRHGSAGSVTVEMAIVAPLLIMLLFVILEMGLLLRDYLVLGTAAREGARAASLGQSTTAVMARARDAAVSLNAAQVTVTTTYRTTTSGAWTTLVNTTENTNAAPTGSEIKVRLAYPHRFVSPFYSLFTHDSTNIGSVYATTVTMRE